LTHAYVRINGGDWQEAALTPKIGEPKPPIISDSPYGNVPDVTWTVTLSGLLTGTNTIEAYSQNFTGTTNSTGPAYAFYYNVTNVLSVQPQYHNTSSADNDPLHTASYLGKGTPLASEFTPLSGAIPVADGVHLYVN